MRLSGKVAVVTGGAAGLERAIAARFACEGALVVAADTNEVAGAALIEELRKRGSEAVFVRTDVSDEGSVKQLILRRWIVTSGSMYW